MTKKVKRLFSQFQPQSYQLQLDIDPDGPAFTGIVIITGKKVGRPSRRLTFHQVGLRISEARIVRRDKRGEQKFPVVRIGNHNTYNEVRLHADELLLPGEYEIYMRFNGKIQDGMNGVYGCTYEIDGKKQRLVATQFESHFARQAFPCIDEPEAKATFGLTLHTPAGVQALGNMPVASQSVKDGVRSTVFETSPRMSSYLLAFIVGDMQSKSAKTKHGVEVRAWATKVHRPEVLDFGLDVAVRAIEFFNDYYGVPYPLAKCDHVALPDFSAGAMENWGLITYRESCLLADPASASQSNRERVALVVAHELSHQWFGDLVTMKWWDDLWLNESFANIMEYVAVNHLFPEWGVWDMFVAQEGLSALRRDAIAGVQAVRTGVNHPDEISTLFDPSIVYAKGGRLLNMLLQYIGEADFRRGLKAYFLKHAYQNTTGADLWTALSAASGKDVAAFMEPWLTRSGFPLVRVEQRGSEVQIAQSHFLLDKTKADASRLWPVPLLASDRAVPALLEERHTAAAMPDDNFVRVNCGAVGHYIVQYAEPAHLASLAEAAGSKKLSAAERLMLLNDSAMLARAGYHHFAATLALLEHYASEDSEPVWDIIALALGDCRRFVDINEKLESPLKAMVCKLIQAQFTRLGFQEKAGESSHDTKLRGAILGLGVYGEHPAVVSGVLERFEVFKKNDSPLAPELRSIILGAAVRRGVPGAFDYLLSLEESTTDINLKHDIMEALTLTRNVGEAKTLLARLKDGAKVRQNVVDYWLAFLIRNRYTREIAWQWLRDNWDWIEETFSGDAAYDSFPRYVASAFNTQALLESYKAFFGPKQDQPGLARNIALGIEEITSRVAWLGRDIESLEKYFALQ